MKYILIIILISSFSKGCSKDRYPIFLVKEYTQSILTSPAGTMFTLAKVDNWDLCQNIVRAYNKARVLNLPTEEYPYGEYGSAHLSYRFTCTSFDPEK